MNTMLKMEHGTRDTRAPARGFLKLINKSIIAIFIYGIQIPMASGQVIRDNWTIITCTDKDSIAIDADGIVILNKICDSFKEKSDSFLKKYDIFATPVLCDSLNRVNLKVGLEMCFKVIGYIQKKIAYDNTQRDDFFVAVHPSIVNPFNCNYLGVQLKIKKKVNYLK